MKKAFTWIFRIFEDQRGTPSSKRFTLFICLAYEYIIIEGDLAGKDVEEMTLFSVVAIILFCLGAVTSEFLNKHFPGNENKQNT